MIKKSSRPILQQIKQAKSKKKKTVTSVFHKGIKTLMKILEKTEPYFVRCINPNQEKSAKVWDESIVEHQLRVGGLLEALRVLKLGYPTRVPYSTLYEKWHDTVDNPLIKNMDEVAFGTSLLLAFDVNEDDYETGLTKIFFKPAKAAILDEIMAKAGQPLTAEQNAKITEYLVGKRIRQLLGAVRTHIKYRKDIRMKRAAEMWQWSGRICSVLGATVVKQLHITRAAILERKRQEGALAMQSMFRGYLERKGHSTKMAVIKDSVKTVVTAYIAMQTKKVYIAALEQFFLDRAAEKARKRAEELAKMAEEQKKQEEAEEAERKAAKLAEEAAAAKAAAMKVVIETPRMQPSLSPEASRQLRQEQEREQAEQIRAQREKQKVAFKKLQREKTQLALDMRDTERMQRQATLQANFSNREAVDAAAADAAAKAALLEREQKSETPNTDSDTDTDSDFDTDSEEDSDFDVNELVENFEQIARLGAKFSRHTGKKIKRKPQLRTVKVSFSEDGKPQTLSWGAGSRAIKMKDIWYISWGHKTPNLIARKDLLDPAKCFSIVGHSEKQVLDLEAYSKREAKIWVKGLRKLKNLTDKRAEELAEMNKSRLLQYASKKDEEKKQLRTKQLKVVQLQQDLFVMTVEAVYKELEGEGVWNIDQSVKDKFNANTMYDTVLKKDIAWRKWQWFVREQITNYLRENDMVKSPRAGRSGSRPTKDSHTKPRFDDDAKETAGQGPDEVTMFLEHYKLQKYDDKLRESGLNNLKDLVGLDESEMAQMAVEVSMTVLHKKHFIEACRDLKKGKYPPEHIKKSMEVDQFLREFGLSQYGVQVKRLGLRELMTIRSMNDKQIEDLAVECGMSTLHKKKFIEGCNQYKKVMKGHKRHESALQAGEKRGDKCMVM